MSKSEIEQYYDELSTNLFNLSEANESLSESVFFDYAMKILIEDGHSMESEDETDGYKYTPFKHTGMRVDGYEFDSNRGLIKLYLCHFNQDEKPKSLIQGELSQLVRNAKRFFEKSLTLPFLNSLEESSEVFELASFINYHRDDISEIRLVIISNGVLSKKISALHLSEEEMFHGIDTSLDVWDLQRFFANELSKGGSEAIEIDLISEFGEGIQALPAHLGSSKYKSYLLAMPGDVLASLYRKHGARLLEANVRSFLQFRGKVNRGIRQTIKENPEMFFAYNNGITATAEKCDIDDSGQIVYLKNLQIVNGGQTTASLFQTKKQDGLSLEKVFVQTKLSVVDGDLVDEIVPKISKYANTQNKISDSDFFSNHPFHRRLQDKSRRISAPLLRGQVRQTKWFYERARGQYHDELGKRTKSEKKAFEFEYPKAQLVTKTDLAKVAVIFDGKPNHAVKGAQIAFKFFAANIVKDWEKNDVDFNDDFYKELIAKQILFIACREIVIRRVSGNGIQPTIAYSLHLLHSLFKQNSQEINYQKIWNEQGISLILSNQLNIIINFVTDFFDKQTLADGRTILSYSKSEVCLKSFNKMGLESGDSLYLKEVEEDSRSKDEVKSEKKFAKEMQKVDNELELLTYFLKLSPTPAMWNGAISFGKSKELLTPNELSILQLMPNYLVGGRQPSLRQLKSIDSLMSRLENEGFDSLKYK